jgi:hypothetical protein
MLLGWSCALAHGWLAKHPPTASEGPGGRFCGQSSSGHRRCELRMRRQAGTQPFHALSGTRGDIRRHAPGCSKNSLRGHDCALGRRPEQSHLRSSFCSFSMGSTLPWRASESCLFLVALVVRSTFEPSSEHSLSSYCWLPVKGTRRRPTMGRLFMGPKLRYARSASRVNHPRMMQEKSSGRGREETWPSLTPFAFGQA